MICCSFALVTAATAPSTSGPKSIGKLTRKWRYKGWRPCCSKLLLSVLYMRLFKGVNTGKPYMKRSISTTATLISLPISTSYRCTYSQESLGIGDRIHHLYKIGQGHVINDHLNGSIIKRISKNKDNGHQSSSESEWYQRGEEAFGLTIRITGSWLAFFSSWPLPHQLPCREAMIQIGNTNR